MSAIVDLSFLRERSVHRRIAAITSLFALAGVLYATFAPKWYRSTITVVPAKSAKGAGGLAALAGADVAGLAAGLGASIGDSADVQRIAAVLQSTAVTDAAIDAFKLKERYDERYQETTRDALWKHCEVKPLPKPGLVQLTCEDKDPEFVARLLSFFADHGNQVFRRVGVSSAAEQVRFLEKRVGELRAEADATAARMREFQEKYHIVDIDTQTKAVVGALASLHNQRISKQIELDYTRTFSSSEEPTARQLESQVAVVDRKLRALEDGPGRPADDKLGTLFPAALTVPRLRAEFETLYRDRKVAEATLVYSLERLEGAKADEARETSTFMVLDPPTVPTRHARPRRLVVTVAMLFFGLVVATTIEWWRSGGYRAVLAAARSDGDHDRK